MGKRKQGVGGRPAGERGPALLSPTGRAAEALLRAARALADEIGADALLLSVDGLDDLEPVRRLADRGPRLVLVARNQEQAELAATIEAASVVTIPSVRLNREGQVRMAVLFALGQDLLRVGQTFVGLAGPVGRPFDCLVVQGISRQWASFQFLTETEASRSVSRQVLQRVVSLAISLGSQGREGKPLGALFVVGAIDEVLRYADPLIRNPFHGYAASERNILDESLIETLREYAMLDGAFLVRNSGEIVAAGMYLRPTVPGLDLPAGLGARHATAAAITATAACLAVTVSESTGTVRVWSRGRMVLEVEKPLAAPTPIEEPDADERG